MKPLIVDSYETTMQRGGAAFVALIGLMPFVMGACTDTAGEAD